MSYTVKEMYYTLQGEGRQVGRSAVFCRFTGCNLWNGRESDRMNAICRFCDTDFIGIDGPGGGRFQEAETLAESIQDTWRGGGGTPLVVFTGGEPLLQLDEVLIKALKAKSFEIAIETNGTRLAPSGIDHICVSPKANAPLLLTEGTELKLVYPQTEAEAQPERFIHLNFEYFYLQPMDGPQKKENTQKAIEYCLAHPSWRLSLQTHKYTDIP